MKPVVSITSRLKSIPQDKFPKHILIIPDGNGRWAKTKGKHVLEGHKKGAEVTKKILQDLSGVSGIKIVTIWGFSADNWKRNKKEVSGLLLLIQRKIQETLNEIIETKRRFIHLGRKDRLPKSLLDILKKAEKQTERNTRQIIALAIDFGGEDQIIRMLDEVKKIDKAPSITNDTLWQLRDSHGLIRSADLLIRTSGEQRTSDIGWLNGAPTELCFIDKLYPDITSDDIIDAIVDFSKRERRMGGRKT